MTESEQTQTRLKLLELAHDMSMMGFSVDKLIESTQKLMRFVHSSNTMYPNQASSKDAPHEAVQQQTLDLQLQPTPFGKEPFDETKQRKRLDDETKQAIADVYAERLRGLTERSKAYSDTPSSSAP